jgi:hypothetical protein
MATASIERRLKRLLAKRDAELPEINERRRRSSMRYYQRRHLKWSEKQPTLWEIIAGPRKPPSIMRIVRNGPQLPKQLTPEQEAFVRKYAVPKASAKMLKSTAID